VPPTAGRLGGTFRGQEASADGDDVKVLYIGGFSRSGSTLLDRMLGQLPGYLSTGELGYLTTHGLQQNRLCGCGDCPFWTRVGQEAFGGWQTGAAQDLVRLYPQVNRHRYVPLLVAPGLGRGFDRQLRVYAGLLGRLYRALGQVGQARVIVDSTIDPSRAFVLRHVPELDLRIMHLVRDSRGTAFSWTKDIVMKDSVDEVVHKGISAPRRTAVRWMAYHLLFHGLSALDHRQLLVRYEDVVRTPKTELARIAAYLGEELDEGALGFVKQQAVLLRGDHTAVGNDMRFATGEVSLKVDDQWRRALPAGDRRIVTALTWPFLKRYGYLGSA
jgi:sulfotransferase family protein